jgi:Xaa-Pro aminopeptidase
MPIEKDSLLLMDVGCFTNNYSSDITRTIPVSGKFTTRQKEVYEVVLDCNKKCIEYAKAGMSWLELNNYAKKLLADGCKKLGLIKEDQELSKYYFHSIGHSLGLDVHDPNIASKGLLEGMVITIEPGLYIPEENIGIRIEDNIVITCDKAINLSKDIIKEVEDIEKYMNK